MANHPPDLILHNANVITMDPRRPRASLVVVKNGVIAFVGRSEDLGAVSPGDALMIDCGGKTIIPGFNDAHCHVFACASSLLSVDCSPASVSSIAGIVEKIRQQAGRTPSGAWIRAAGYNEFYLADGRHPTRRDLDLAAPDHPVKLSHRSSHACVLNSMALRLAGITIETPDPQGGLIDRELETGEPSGLLFGMNSYVTEKVMPPLSDTELSEGIRLVNQAFLSLGITSVQDASVRNGLEQWRVFKKLRDSGQFTPRVCMMFGLDALADFKRAGMAFGFGDDGLRLGAVKIALDETRGELNPHQEQLDAEAALANESGFQVAIHAVQESTVRAAAAALEYCICRSLESLKRRHRVEHCSECPPDLVERLSNVGAVVVTQPAFLYYSGERYSRTVEEQQLPWLYRVRSFVENGLRPAASSDCPVVPPNPLAGVYAAVTRKAENGLVLSPDEAVTPGQALEMYTLAGAYASFEEGFKGSIEMGRAADLAVLSADPTSVPHEEIKDIRVERTIIDGRVAWER